MAGFGSRGLGSYVFSGICVLAVGGGIAWMIATGGRGDDMRVFDALDVAREAEPAPETNQDATFLYQGEHVKLRRAYNTLQDYRDDPNHLPSESVAQVDRLMRAAQLPHHFEDRMSVLIALSQLEFPGFPSMRMGETVQPDGTTLNGHALILPAGGGTRLRYFVFRGTAGGYDLIDDFIADGEPLVRVRDEGGKLAYLDGKGEVVLTRP